MQFIVKSYNKYDNYHECTAQDGLHRMDLFVCGELPPSETKESIVGKTVEISEFHPFVEIADHIELV